MVAVPLIVFTVIASTCVALKLPPYMKQCSRHDPKLDDCIIKHGREAIPHFVHGDSKYGVPNLDPFEIEELKINQGTQQVALGLTLSKVKLYGISNLEFVGSRVDLQKMHIEGDFKTDKSIQIVGPYKASGRVLLLPITGEGIANLTFTDLFLTLKFDYDLVKRKGTDYMHLLRAGATYKIGAAHFHLTNLFNGDKLLGENMNRFLNENWKELVSTFGPELEAAMRTTFQHLVVTLTAMFPYTEIFPEKV